MQGAPNKEQQHLTPLEENPVAEVAANLKVLKGTVDISTATMMFISTHIGPHSLEELTCKLGEGRQELG